MNKKRTRKSTPVSRAVGRVVNRRRNSKGVSQFALALDSEVDRSYIYLVEQGYICPTINTFLKVCGGLGADPPEVMHDIVLALRSPTPQG